jgi:hypothetical protein
MSGVQDAIDIAGDIIDTLIIILNDLGIKIENARVIAEQIFNVLVDVFGNVRNALEVTIRVMIKIHYYLVKYGPDAVELVKNLYNIYEDVRDIIVTTYGETQDALYTAEQVYNYFKDLVIDFNEEVEDAIRDSANADYQLREENYYVALGDAIYVEELAELLLLGDRYDQFGLYDDYTDAVANADLITIKFNRN